MRVNGREKQAGGISLLEFLEKEGYDASRVAVERNGAVVPRSLFASTALLDDDKLEIVSFVGGG